MNATVDDYIGIARQVKTIHKHLLCLIDNATGKIPKDIIHFLYKMEDYLFLVKERAESQMLIDYPEIADLHTENYPDFSHIFYGGFKDIE